MESFEQIYEFYFKDVYKYAFSLCRNPAQAEEITQETFFQALKSMHFFRGECKMLVWLCQIAKHAYFAQLRKEKRRSGQPVEEALETSPHLSVSFVEQQLFRALIQSHLRDCPDCAKTLKQMKTECCLSNDQEQEHEAIVKDLADTWRSTVKKTFLRGVLLTLCTFLLLFGAYWSLTRVLLVTVPTDKLEISIESVTEQSVKLSFKVTDHKKVSLLTSHTTADGKCYFVIKRGILATQNGAGENWECVETISRTGTLTSGDKVPIRSIYYGTESDSVLIWEADGGS